MNDFLNELEVIAEVNECESADEEYEVVDWDEYRESYKDYISSYIY